MIAHHEVLELLLYRNMHHLIQSHIVHVVTIIIDMLKCDILPAKEEDTVVEYV